MRAMSARKMTIFMQNPRAQKALNGYTTHPLEKA